MENKTGWPYHNFDIVLFADITMTNIKCGWVAAYCRHIFKMNILKTNMHKPSNLEDRIMTYILIGMVRISKGVENIY